MTVKLHAAGYSFEDHRKTVCHRYSPKADFVMPAHNQVHSKARGGMIRTTERSVRAVTYKPLAFADRWDDVTCQACAKHRWTYEANRLPFTCVVD